jgi:ribulose-phosphate 3-epimerase
MSLLPDEPIVVPSILAANPKRLRKQVREVVDAGARAIHIDVMDGCFVPAHAFSPLTVAMLADDLADLDVLLDVHLMVERPERYVRAYASAGADLISVHLEVRAELRFALDAIHDSGCLVGVAIRPSTPAWLIREVADELDVALCMTVEPGAGGQEFIASSPRRVAALASLLDGHGHIEVDGGVNLSTAATCARSGAQLLVAGSAIFAAPEPGEAFRELDHAVTRELV